MTKQYYELTDDKSTKFWEVEQKDSSVYIRWGKIGTNGQSKTKELDSQEAAIKEVEKLIKQKTKKGYAEADALPSYQEDKDKIKISISNLKKKLSKYKSYYKSSNAKITRKVKKNVDSVDQLCKLADKLSNCSDLYQETKHKDYYLPKVVIYALDSAEIAWSPVTKQCKDIENIKRDGTMFGCFPWTSKSYPWPTYKNGRKELYAAPGIQIDLIKMKKLNNEELGDGLLQVWFTEDFSSKAKDTTSIVRVIPRKVINKEAPDNVLHDFEVSDFAQVSADCWDDEMDFPGWIVSDYKIDGIQTDDGNFFEGGVDESENEFSDSTLDLISRVSELMDEMHCSSTSFFGVPDPLQQPWDVFYREGYRNLLSLTSGQYFCMGSGDDTGQLMYKKDKNKVDFSFDWASFG
jgi:predicted DNA-binding WGR domain protein